VTRKLRQHALEIFRAGLAAADPASAVERHFRIRPERYRDIWVVGAGKASAKMATALERRLGSRITGGFINVKDGHLARLRRIELHECGHPIPDERGVAGARRIAEIARRAGPRDLVIAVISGGASAVMPLPAGPVTLAEKQETTRLLLACGATIHEMNAVRKHLSAIKGGRLAEMAAPAQVISLILSDVVGDDLSVIGSGPTAPDPSTFAGALAILDKFGLREKVPAAVRERLERGGDETPKSLTNVRNVIVGSNRLAMDAAAKKARALGYRTLVLSSQIEGETRDVARVHAAIIKEHTGCVLSGGETTVTLRGNGLGGRNQEFVLAAALDIAGWKDTVVLSAGTDGNDGPTDAAGAVADGGTVPGCGLDAKRFLAENDSYHFFAQAGGLIKTGPTGTNVMDLRILLRAAPPRRSRQA
jgi:hydroxypyruvate reductase